MCLAEAKLHSEIKITYIFTPSRVMVFLGGSAGKESPCQCQRCRRCRFDLWVRKIPWRRKWQLTPVLLPGKFHGQRSLVGYSPWGRGVRRFWVTNTHSIVIEMRSRGIFSGFCPLESLDCWKLKVPLSISRLSKTNQLRSIFHIHSLCITIVIDIF